MQTPPGPCGTWVWSGSEESRDLAPPVLVSTAGDLSRDRLVWFCLSRGYNEQKRLVSTCFVLGCVPGAGVRKHGKDMVTASRSSRRGRCPRLQPASRGPWLSKHRNRSGATRRGDGEGTNVSSPRRQSLDWKGTFLLGWDCHIVSHPRTGQTPKCRGGQSRQGLEAQGAPEEIHGAAEQ